MAPCLDKIININVRVEGGKSVTKVIILEYLFTIILIQEINYSLQLQHTNKLVLFQPRLGFDADFFYLVLSRRLSFDFRIMDIPASIMNNSESNSTENNSGLFKRVCRAPTYSEYILNTENKQGLCEI